MKKLIRNLTAAILAILVILVITVVSTAAYAGVDYGVPEDDLEEVSADQEALSPGVAIPYLPDGARSVIIERTQYFVSGSNWFLPIIVNKVIKYQVVFAPWNPESK